MYQSLEQIIQEGNDRHYSIDFDTSHNHVTWWIFTRNTDPEYKHKDYWTGNKNTIEKAKEELYNQLTRLPMQGNYPWFNT